MITNESIKNFWQQIAENYGWPEIVYLKDIHKLPCFPYSKGGFRNRVTGKDADPELTGAIIEIGRYKAIYRKALLPWLNAKTTTPKAA